MPGSMPSIESSSGSSQASRGGLPRSPCGSSREPAAADARTGSVLPGAEPYCHDGGPIGALLCHGFTSTPQPLRPWAQYLAAADLSVGLPRLPGHGTRWQDLTRTGWPDWYAAVDRGVRDLRERCDTVLAMGLSMGAALALRLAQQHGTGLDGLVLVNPSVTGADPRLRVVPLLKHLVASTPGISGDIKRPDRTELAYSRTPLHAVDSLRDLWRQVRHDLADVTQPLLVYRSTVDHVVGPQSVELLLARVSSTDVTVRWCTDSYHVATLDNDAEAIFAGSLAFARRIHARTAG